VGDRLWAGKPPWRKTRHPGLLSLSLLSVTGWNENTAKAGEVNRHIAWYTSPYPWSCCVRWLPSWMKLASGDQRRHTGSGSTLDDDYNDDRGD